MTENKGIQSDLIPRIATGFCGGMARTGNMCGAVSGAIMAVNIFHGRMDATSTLDQNYAKVRELIAHFEKKFGTTNCKGLIGCDLATPEGHQFFKENNLIARCKVFSEEATRMVMTII